MLPQEALALTRRAVVWRNAGGRRRWTHEVRPVRAIVRRRDKVESGGQHPVGHSPQAQQRLASANVEAARSANGQHRRGGVEFVAADDTTQHIEGAVVLVDTLENHRPSWRRDGEGPRLGETEWLACRVQRHHLGQIHHRARRRVDGLVTEGRAQGTLYGASPPLKAIGIDVGRDRPAVKLHGDVQLVLHLKHGVVPEVGGHLLHRSTRQMGAEARDDPTWTAKLVGDIDDVEHGRRGGVGNGSG
jgi:hypothetical protein